MEVANSVKVYGDYEKNKLNVVEFYHKILWDNQQLEPFPLKHGRIVSFLTDPPTIHEYESEYNRGLAFSYHSSSHRNEMHCKDVQYEMARAHELDTQSGNNQRKGPKSKFASISNIQSNNQPSGFSMDPINPDMSNDFDVFSNDLFKNLQIPEALLNVSRVDFICERNDCVEISNHIHPDNAHTDERSKNNEKRNM